jgi:inorganic triphosphatase YgiF
VETEVQRSLRVLRCEQGEIELVIDVGEVRTHLGRIPVHEVELELRRGDPALLFDVALQLQETVALRPSAESKPERGFALLSGRPPSPRRAGRLLHEADASVDDLLAALFDDCIAQIAGNRVIARTGHDPSGVHQLRIGARRLRSALSLFRGLIPHELADPLRDELRWLGGSLGPARDLDVFATDLIEPLARARPEDGALKRLRDEALAARADAYDRVRDALDSPRYAQLVLMLGAIQSRRAWREQPLSEESARLFSPAREVAIGMLARRHKRVRRYGRRVASHSAAELHDLRIRLKKLRYATGFLLGLFAGKDERREASRYGRRVIELQDILGHLNDAITAEHVLDDLIARLADEAGPDHLRAAGFVVGWAARSAEFEMRRFDKRWRAFRKLRPFWER